ncbi:hypothetical protein D7Z54_16550 [Salibacterium salarium]|uniref:Uncharacterized protein n=1 Tax=Salibacterium salarium TaxID=284579 RepID=A0A3R9P3W4_9BACI|nr:hypothetical protein [Salibacterium salarium]RSL32260.1 hypothetical protein D7Z54_16550 [Salibacterium salarium]
MVFIMMGAGAILGYFVLYIIPLEINRRLRIQLITAAFMIALLVYLIQEIYFWSLGLIVLAALLLLFSIIFGKQMEYADTVAEESEKIEKIDEAVEIKQQKNYGQAREMLESPAYSVSADNRYLTAADELNVDNNDAGDFISKKDDMLYTSSFVEEESTTDNGELDFFQHRSFLIEKDEQSQEEIDMEELEEDEAEDLVVQQNNTLASDEINKTDISDKRLRLLEELDDEYAINESNW